jgi:DNA-binding LacI/PurR family transcriptional regulator
MAQPREKIAKLAVDTALKMMNDPAAGQGIKLLRPTLIVRKSSIPAPEVKKTECAGQTSPR